MVVPRNEHRLSTASSAGTATTYPSTISSLRGSTLGLTESSKDSEQSTLSPNIPVQRTANRTRSKNELRPTHSHQSLSSVIEARSSVVNRKSSRTFPPTIPQTCTAIAPAAHLEVSPSKIPSSPCSRDKQKRTTTRRPDAAETVQVQTQKVIASPAPASPSQTKDSMAEAWEAELARNVGQLRIGKQMTAKSQVQERTTDLGERQSDAAWEVSGLWESGRDASREAEERIRREVRREIAYPPTKPRIPIRAAPSGVTSIHVGVRPRLHPSRATHSLQRNQPDDKLDTPLLSPLQPSLGVDIALDASALSKATKQYDAWMSRKAEREGQIDDHEEAHGTRDWTPKDRVIARPGAVDGYAHSEGYQTRHFGSERAQNAAPSTYLPTPPETAFVYPYNGYSQGFCMDEVSGQSYESLVNPDSMMLYNQQNMWGPQLWQWGNHYPEDECGDQYAVCPKPAQVVGSMDPAFKNDQGDFLQYPNMMMMNPYMAMMAQGGSPGVPTMMGANVGAPHNPKAAMIGQQQSTHLMEQVPTQGGEGELRAFDSSQMKRGRMGHYGYLEGRELAGPPVGYLPAGLPPMSKNPSQTHITPSHGSSISGFRASHGYQVAPSTPSLTQRSAWGDPSSSPRARYDGVPVVTKYLQADVDSPYPRTESGGVASAWTRYGADNQAIVGLDGRLGAKHRRQREGKV